MDLIDRDDDRQALDQLVDAAREGISGSLVLRGEPGIGKTLLLDYAADRATGMQLARVTAIESEMELVSDRVADINARSLAHPGAGYITISPLHFNLAPGKSELIQIRANMPASVHGDHYANTVFAAAPAHPGRGTMHVAGAVASSVEIHAPATTTRGTHRPAGGLRTSAAVARRDPDSSRRASPGARRADPSPRQRQARTTWTDVMHEEGRANRRDRTALPTRRPN
jgi:hypothetical protein